MKTTIDYIHHSPSSLNLFCASPSMWVLEKIVGLRQPVGAPAHRGVAIEAGVVQGLDGAKLEDSVKIALARYDTLMALSVDDRREKYRETIPGMVGQALAELRDYGKPSSMQGFVTWQPPGLRLPIVGYYDFMWEHSGIITDLKTTERMPSEIKVPHARQVALYAPSDNFDARLTYITPKKSATYKLENIREHREALRQIALRVENFLALSNDIEFFKGITCPDVESFYWGGPARQLAYEHWGI
jgi:hypothetical protein